MSMKFAVFIIICLFINTAIFSQNYSSQPGSCGFHKGNDVSVLNGSGTLGQTYSNSDCGLNYVQDSKLIQTRSQSWGYNTNGSGLPTTLAIAGIPSCATILRAYLWCTVSYTSSSVMAVNFIFNSNSVPAVNIGTDAPKCWGENGTVVYRGDVTAYITGNANYSVDIIGLTNKNWEVDGITLMVIYKDNSAAYQGSLVLWDGAITCSLVGCTINQTMSGISACGNSTAANAFLVVSDMQDNPTGSETHSATLNGTTSTFPSDFYNFNVGNTSVTSGQATANFGAAAASDCYCMSLMGLYYQTTACTTCTPSAVSVTVTPTPATCGASNGSATASASGAPTPYTYTWSTGATTTGISNLAAGSYSVDVVDATGCSFSQTFTITTSVGPIVVFNATPVACAGQNTGTAVLTASGGISPYTYGWVTTPVETGPIATGLSAGTYSVLVTDATGCSSTHTVAITEPTALTVTSTPVSNPSCFGSTDGSITSSASGGNGTYTYAWTPSGQNTQTASNLGEGTYSVLITDNKGCTAGSSSTISQPTDVVFTHTVNDVTCGGANGSATVTSSGGTGPYTYLWLISPVQTTASISNLSAGTYNVLVTDVNGCSKSQSVVIGGSGAPVADFNLSTDMVSLFEPSVSFSDISGGNPVQWNWNFGDTLSGANDSSNLQHPAHVYSDTGTYCITLIITDQTSVCKDTITKCLRVENPFAFYIPNSFTPNNDGHNEVFQGYGTQIKNFNMLVFDRWGNLIYETDDITKGWNGKLGSGLVQEDVYVWKVEITDTLLLSHKFIGHVTLVR